MHKPALSDMMIAVGKKQGKRPNSVLLRLMLKLVRYSTYLSGDAFKAVQQLREGD